MKRTQQCYAKQSQNKLLKIKKTPARNTKNSKTRQKISTEQKKVQKAATNAKTEIMDYILCKTDILKNNTQELQREIVELIYLITEKEVGSNKQQDNPQEYVI